MAKIAKKLATKTSRSKPKTKGLTKSKAVVKKPAAKKAASKKTAVKKVTAPKLTVKKSSKQIKHRRQPLDTIPMTATIESKIAEPSVPEFTLPKLESPTIKPIAASTTQPEQLPQRAPVRKVFGADNSVTIIEAKTKIATPSTETQENQAPSVTQSGGITLEKGMTLEKTLFLDVGRSHNVALAVPAIPPTQLAEPVSAPSLAPVPNFQPSKHSVTSVPARKFDWSNLPAYLPASVRFSVGAARRESGNAASSPFPFAKYISALPQQMCGLEFAMLLLSVEHESDRIAQICGLSLERVETLLANASSNITEIFAALCPSMDRKWRARVNGSSTTVESLIEHHIESKVDRTFQAMLAAVTLAGLGVKSVSHPAQTSNAARPPLN